MPRARCRTCTTACGPRAERGGLSGVDARALELKMQGALSVVCLAAKIEDGPCTPQAKRGYGVNRSDGEHKTEAR